MGGQEPVLKTFCTFDTSILFTARGARQQLPVSAEVHNAEDFIIFRANLTDAVDATLNELESLADGLPLGPLTQGLRGFELASVLRLQDIAVSVNPRARIVNYVSFGVESARIWTLVHNSTHDTSISLEKVYLSFTLFAPAGSRRLAMQVGGEIDIGAGRIQVAGAYPDFTFTTWLHEGTVIKLRDVFAYFTGSAAGDIPDMDVTEFEVNITPGAEYSARVEVLGYWPIEVGSTELAVEEALFALDYVPNGTTSVSLEGQFEVAAIDYAITADYPAGTAGWLFEGYTLSDDVLNLTDIVSRLTELFEAPATISLPEINLDNLLIAFNPQTKYFKFKCEARMAVEGEQKLDMLVTVELVPEGGGHRTNVSDTLTVGRLQFDVHYTRSSVSDIFLTTYTHAAGAEKLNLKELVGAVSAAAADYVPASLEIDLKNVLLGFRKNLPPAGIQPAPGAATESKFIFGFDLAASISLSDLPLVGQNFPPEQTLSVEDLQFLVVSKPLTQNEADDFNNIIDSLPVPPTRLPTTQADGAGTVPLIAVPDGLTVSAQMNFGGSPTTLSLPVAGTSPQTVAATQPAQPTTTQASSDKAKWYSLQKKFGPVYFEKVGVLYQGDTLWFLLNASLSVGGLTLSLDGLAVGSSVRSFDPKFDLRGLGLDYEAGGAIEIGGAFLRIPKETSGKPHDEYDGAAVIKTEQLTLSAIGSYAELGGHPSLFVYAVLDYPLGGPAFFYVTGLAAGFGYNRALVIPPVGQLAQFPLVADAVNGAEMPSDPGQKLASIQHAVPPATGEYFLAFGIKFTSFKLIDSFALLTVSSGTQFEVNLLGLSTLIVPTPVPGQSVTPLAEVQMALRATYSPSRGFLGVSAQLTPASFILSRDCHLTGGFAFYSWFSGEHKGDFVLTLGGYHPDYSVPTYYPSVPRVGFNWRVNDELSIKGGAYYALTASALMAGGSLEATWESDDLEAHFKVSADFIVYWQPYHYDARISVEFGVSYTFSFFGRHTISVDVGAELHIWGPEFAGTASIDISVISFEISFGAGSGRGLQPITWQAFHEAFLPKDKDGRLVICAVSVAAGLVSAPQDKPSIDWVINPKTFVLVTNSVIPSKTALKGGAPFAVAGNETGFGIGPMAVTADNFSSSHAVTIGRRREGGGAEEYESIEADFEFRPVLKNVPVGLWGETLTPDMNGPGFVRDTLAGFELRPAARPAAGATADIARSALQFENEDAPTVYIWGAHSPFVASPLDDAARRGSIADTIKSDATNAKRAPLLTALGFAAGVDLSKYDGGAFIIAPQIETLES